MQSYALGEIPSLTDRITIVRQLWDLTSDVLVIIFLSDILYLNAFANLNFKSANDKISFAM